MPEFSHVSVLLNEAIEALEVKPDGLYVDGTAGGGGHSLEIARRLGEGGLLIAIDRDEEAIAATAERLAGYENVTEIHRENFTAMDAVLAGRRPDGVLLDLGVSSHQIDTAERGFSYMKDAPLDMRMDRSGGPSACDVVNGYSREELIRVLRDWGEERFAGRISSLIINEREKNPIRTTGELADLVKRAVPQKGESHPEKRTFQAIRIEVNRELESIEPALASALDALKPGGRIVVITFHSLEDRIVKQFFAEQARGCVCPPEIPVCVCGRKPRGTVITRKPVLPGAAECEANPRAKSAKLRVFQKN